MHYPPTNKNLLEKSDFIKLMQKYNVKKCIYGHLHGEALNNEVIEGNIRGNRNRTCQLRLSKL